MMEKKYFDPTYHRLVCLKEKATSQYWDRHWKKDDFVKEVLQGAKGDFVKRITKKYLPIKSTILEGGCGNGSKVYDLATCGFNVYGIDSAIETVQAINDAFPSLQISTQDIRSTEFSDAFFDGYWSIGVIEHFFEGYHPALIEAGRVLKSGGYLFLTFPAMNCFRRLKARIGLFHAWNDEIGSDTFYQYILSISEVKNNLVTNGFVVVEEKYFDGLKGIKDEVSFLSPVLQPMYSSSHMFFRIIRKGLSIFLDGCFGHSILLVCKKK